MDHTHLLLKPDNVDVVIYHGNCSDGFCSASIAKNYFKQTKTIEYIPAFFNVLPPPITGKNILFCDFAYDLQTMQTIIETAEQNGKSVAIIDHHKSAEYSLCEISQKYKYFDLTHCGAHLTWKYFYNDAPIPYFIQYIEDVDIHADKLPNTHEIASFIYSLQFDFNEYEQYFDDVNFMDVALLEGRKIKKQNDTVINEKIKQATHKLFTIDGRDYTFVIVETNILKTEIAKKLSTTHPMLDVALVYQIKNDLYELSFWRCNNNIDVSEIANKIAGGAGHDYASGAVISKDDDSHLFWKLIE